MSRENMGTNIEPGFVQRAAQGFKYIFGRGNPVPSASSNDPGRPMIQTPAVIDPQEYQVKSAPPESFFGPGQPLPPTAQHEAGRQLDFPYAWNMRTTPRQQEGNTFDTLRALADTCDVLRLVIETRKDQLCKLDWQIVPRDEDKEAGPDAKTIEEFLRIPDREHPWDAWLRMLLEDLFVIDAPAIYPRMTRGGALYALEPVDGATINRMLDRTGRTPLPPDPAYQQILKGMPAIDYTSDELIYAPRNPRTHRVYGYSPVEQILLTVNTAIRRAVHVLQFYTEGSTPDLIWGVPETWQPDQIKQFQQYWDSLLQGNTAARRKGLFVPGGIKPFDTKEQALKDEFDEWLARIVCYCFSLPPTPFVKQVNRATAQTAQQSAIQEGLHPLMRWVKGLIDCILVKQFKRADLQFAWKMQEDVEPLVQAQIDKIYLDSGVMDADEVRADRGMPPRTPEQIEAAKPVPPALPPGAKPGEPGPGKPPPPDTGKVAKLAKADDEHEIKMPAFDRPDVTREREALTEDLAGWLADEAEAAGKDVEKASEEHAGDATALGASLAGVLVGAIKWSRWDSLIILIRPRLEVVGDSSGLRALIALPLDKEMVEAATPAIEDAAIAYARSRAAEMVGRKYNALGELIDNPNPRWAITDTTRAALKAEIERNLAEGADPTTLARAIRESTQFGRARATMVARTELLMAHNAANLASAKEGAALGLKMKKKWLTANDDKVCPDCVANEGAGEIELDESFPSVHQTPPEHPNCRCGVVAVARE